MILRYDIDDKFNWQNCTKQLNSFIRRFDLELFFSLKQSLVKASSKKEENLYKINIALFDIEQDSIYEKPIAIDSDKRFIDNKKMFLDITTNCDISYNNIKFAGNIDLSIERILLLVKFMHKYGKLILFI